LTGEAEPVGKGSRRPAAPAGPPADAAPSAPAGPSPEPTLPAWRGLFAGWAPFEIAWLAVFSIVNVWLFFAWDDTWIGLLTSLTGMLNVVLVAKGKISNYWFGLVNVSLYGWTAYGNQYYGEVMLNLGYFLPMQVVGLYLWRRNVDPTKTADDVRARWLSWRERWLWLAVSVAGTAGYAVVLERLGGNLPAFDSASTVLSVIAMILMVRRVAEQWILWIAIDVVSIYLWLVVLDEGGNEVSMVVMWSAYLVNAIYGMWRWKGLAGAEPRVEPAERGVA